MSRRVRRIGMSLAHLSSRRGIPYSYKVLNDRQVLNAFAVPGGSIYITRSLVETVSNDAELAYILGHETAHIDRRHTAQMMGKYKRAQKMAVNGGQYVGSGTGRLMLRVASEIGIVVWAVRYSRTLETEADLAGVRWMSRLGYDPHAAVKILGKVSARHNLGASRGYFSTHPAPSERETRILLLIGQEKLMQIAKRNGGPRLQESRARTNLHKARK
jgi:predicted Zn-dependent protease